MEVLLTQGATGRTGAGACGRSLGGDSSSREECLSKAMTRLLTGWRTYSGEGRSSASSPLSSSSWMRLRRDVGGLILSSFRKPGGGGSAGSPGASSFSRGGGGGNSGCGGTFMSGPLRGFGASWLASKGFTGAAGGSGILTLLSGSGGGAGISGAEAGGGGTTTDDILFRSGTLGGAADFASLTAAEGADGGIATDVEAIEISWVDVEAGEGAVSGAGAAAPAEMGGGAGVTAGFGAWGRAGAEMISAAVCLGGSGGVGERAEDSSGKTGGAGRGGSLTLGDGAPALMPRGSLWADGEARESAEGVVFETTGLG